MKIATIETDKGSIRLQLYDDMVPRTCANFEKLATEGFYDGLVFHRVIEEFMVQTGCPLRGSTASTPCLDACSQAKTSSTASGGATRWFG